MKQANDFAYDMLDFDIDHEKTVFCAGRDVAISEKNGVIILDIPFDEYTHDGIFRKKSTPPLVKRFFLSARGPSCLRFAGPLETGSDFGDIAKNDDESPMLCFSTGMGQQPLSLEETEKDLFRAVDQNGRTRMTLSRIPHQTSFWSGLQRPPDPMIQLTLYPDGSTPVVFAAYDQFFPGKFESLPPAFTNKETFFSMFADGDEHFLRNRRTLWQAGSGASAEYSNEPVIWARAGWAGCQRYPLHWGGDTERPHPHRFSQ